MKPIMPVPKAQPVVKSYSVSPFPENVNIQEKNKKPMVPVYSEKPMVKASSEEPFDLLTNAPRDNTRSSFGK